MSRGVPAPRAAVARAAGARCAPAWWDDAGDALLARLVDHGLASDSGLRRRAQELVQEQARARGLQQGWRHWVAQGLGWSLPNPQRLALRLAAARQRKAASIALDYVEVRRLQALLALRLELQRPLRSDEQIAGWRQEAGLASAVDGGLAHTLVGMHAAAIDATRVRLASARTELARAAGMPPGALQPLLAHLSWLPRLRPPAPCAACVAAGPAQADLAAADARVAALRRLEPAAARTVADARSAYRLGTGGFADLYVAETAVLELRVATLDARAQAARATIRLSAAGRLGCLRRQRPEHGHAD